MATTVAFGKSKVEDSADGLESVSGRINENGRLQLIPENNEEVSVVDIAPAVKEGVEHMIANNFFLG